MRKKFLEHPRHIEFQVLGDQHGKVIHLGERECSIQRRHQKLVEESPSPVVDAKLRKELGAKVVKALEEIGYTNAGTIEFLMDQDGAMYFIEMNTRHSGRTSRYGTRHRSGFDQGADPHRRR